MRRLMPKGSAWRVMQFDTLRRRLIKIAARVVELKKQIRIHLPSSTPDQAIFGIIKFGEAEDPRYGYGLARSTFNLFGIAKRIVGCARSRSMVNFAR
jgi:hypothetical protein